MSQKSWVFRVAGEIQRNWAALLGLSAFFLAIAPLKGSYIDLGFPPIFYRAFLWIGVAAAMLIVVAALARSLGEFLERDATERFRSLKRDEIQDLLPFYERVVSTERPTLNELKEVFNANNQVFRVLERQITQGRKKNTKILGFCTIVPISKEAAPLLAKEELNGLRMSRVHVLPPKRACKTIYIGSIGGEGHHARGAVLNYVLGLIDDWTDRGVEAVYTRPITVDGLRVAKKYGFRPVKADVGPNDLKRLYVLDLQDRTRSNSARQKHGSEN